MAAPPPAPLHAPPAPLVEGEIVPAPLVEGEIVLAWRLRPVAGSREACGPLAYVATEVYNVRVADGGGFVDVYFYDARASAAAAVAVPGARLRVDAPPSRLVAGGPLDRVAARRRRGAVCVAPAATLAAAGDAAGRGAPAEARAGRGGRWAAVDDARGRARKRRAPPAADDAPADGSRVDRDHLTLRGAAAAPAGAELHVLAAVAGASAGATAGGDAYVSLELRDGDGARTATLVAFQRPERAGRLPRAARAGDAVRCRRVVREPPARGDAATHVRLRSVAWSAFAVLRGARDAAPGDGFDEAHGDLRLHRCGAARMTAPTARQLAAARGLLGAAPRGAAAPGAPPPALADARGLAPGAAAAVRCAVAATRDAAAATVVRLVDDTGELDALAPRRALPAAAARALAAAEPGDAVAATLRAADARGAKVFLLADLRLAAA